MIRKYHFDKPNQFNLVCDPIETPFKMYEVIQRIYDGRTTTRSNTNLPAMFINTEVVDTTG